MFREPIKNMLEKKGWYCEHVLEKGNVQYDSLTLYKTDFSLFKVFYYIDYKE